MVSSVGTCARMVIVPVYPVEMKAALPRRGSGPGGGWRQSLTRPTWHGARSARSWKSTTCAPPSSSTKPSSRPRCSEQTRSGLACGQVGERAVREGDRGGTVVVHRGRVEAELVQHADGRLDARSAPDRGRGGPGVGPAGGPPPRPVRPPTPASAASSQQHAGQHGEHRAARGRATGASGAREYRCLRPAHGATGVGTGLEQADVAHPLEVGPHRVGVQVQEVGHLRRGQGPGRTGQFQVDRVPRVVAQRLQQVEAVLRCHAPRLAPDRDNTASTGKITP